MLYLRESLSFFKHKAGKATILLLFGLLGLCTICLVTIITSAEADEPYKKTKDRLDWWQESIVYQIYPRSFQDSDGDGTGDLNGILSRLEYLQQLGVGAVWLSPFYKSPMKDFGYDVADYRAVDPLFGIIEDFDAIVQRAHRLGLKVIVDYVPNHTSDQHDWFQLSRNKTGKYKNYYIWSDGVLLDNGTRVPPNNWISVFDAPCWHWDDRRQQYYYHAFLKEQPDLNYRNPDVLKEMDNVLRFWLDRGVDGFRIDAIPYLFEVKNLSQNVKPGDVTTLYTVDATKFVTAQIDATFHKGRGKWRTKDQHGYRFMMNQPEIFDVLRGWRRVLDEYEEKDRKIRWLVAETANIPDTERHKYYEAGATPFFFGLIADTATCDVINAKCIRNIIQRGVELKPGHWPNFVTGNHDNWRVADRYGPEFVDAMTMLLLTLPGTPTTYNGEEIGLANGNYTGLVPRDPFANISGNWSNSRDPERNPFQWDTTKNAGFSTAPADKLWLPITPNTDYRHVNVEVESRRLNTTLSVYKTLAKLRQQPSFRNPRIHFPTTDDDVLHYTRSDGTTTYCVVINFGQYPTTFDTGLKQKRGFVEAATVGIFHLFHGTINMERMVLYKGDGLVIRELP